MNLKINLLMPETNTIKAENLPVTKSRIIADLQNIGVRPGMTLLVHSSLKSMGWVCGKEIAVIDALLEILTPEGTLVMPTHCGDYSDPSYWLKPPIPEDWISIIKAEMPAFRPEVTPTRHMGLIPEAFRKYPEVLRSNHPCVSFSALGKNAAMITANHSLAYSLGRNSPLARIYGLDGHILLIGVGYDTNTSIHLGEYLANCRKKINCGAPILENGTRIWKEYIDLEYDSDCFAVIGLDFEKEANVKVANIGYAESRLINQKGLVDFSLKWFNNY